MNTLLRLVTACLMVTPVLFTNCTKDNESTGVGQLSIELTDTPVDDPDVKSIFVTIAEIHLDGKIWEGFSGKKTVDLLALQNGKLYELGEAETDAGVYNRIELILDRETDADNNTPASYVVMQDNAKHPINFNSKESAVIAVQGTPMEVERDMATNAVIDFDLRKCVVSTTGNSGAVYAFVNGQEMTNALRIVDKDNTGNIAGICQQDTTVQKVVVYAYQKGTFKATELEPQGESGIRFMHAVTSDAVDAQGNYMLSFLAEGDYELVFAGYNEDINGDLGLVGLLSLNALTGGQAQEVSVTSRATATFNVEITGVLP